MRNIEGCPAAPKQASSFCISFPDVKQRLF